MKEKVISKEIIPAKYWIDSDSDAGIGFYIEIKSDFYGNIHWGIYIGRYLLSYSARFGLNFCDYFATGLGG